MHFRLSSDLWWSTRKHISICRLEWRQKGKIEVPRDVRNSKSGNMTSSEENGLNIRTNASPKWEKTRCPIEYASSFG